MKILIVYDSLYGNTEKIGFAIRDGFKDPETKCVKSTGASAEDVNQADLLIIGSPTYGGRPSEPIKNIFKMISGMDLKNKYAAAFDTGMLQEGRGGIVKGIIKFFGYASPRIADELNHYGMNVIGAETFFVLGKEGPLKEGELERAKNWAKTLQKQIK